MDAITAELEATGWMEIPAHKWNAYGEIARIEQNWASDTDPQLLVVVTDLWIPCPGTADPDSTVYVFTRRNERWELVLAAAADYDPGGGAAQTAMRYSVSPSDRRGEWSLGVAHVPPRCNSSANVLQYKLVEPGPSPFEPHVLLSGRARFDPQFQPPFEFSADRKSLVITRAERRRLDGEPGVFISWFEIRDGQPIRFQPWALVPEDFLDQWIQSQWDQAALWVHKEQESTMKEWHAKLGTVASDSAAIEFVQPCPREPQAEQSWLVGLWFDRQLNPSIGVEWLYVRISKAEGAFYVDAVYERRPPGCPGISRPKAWDRTLPSWDP